MKNLRLRAGKRPSRRTRGRRRLAHATAKAEPAKQSPSKVPARPDLRFLPDVYGVNERFLEMLQQLARAAPPVALPWLAELRETLLAMPPERRALAAGRSFLLVNMRFDDAAFWRHITSRRSRSGLFPAQVEIFPRTEALDLARATLVLAWHAVRADRIAAMACLGMSPAVLDIIRRLGLADLGRIAAQRFTDVRPRWEDRPQEWRRLLIEGQSRDIRRTRELSLRGLRLITGALLASEVPRQRSAANGADSTGDQGDAGARAGLGFTRR